MTVAHVTVERVNRESRAKERAEKISTDREVFASGNMVRDTQTRGVVCACETHWDACLVMLAHSRSKIEENSDAN